MDPSGIEERNGRALSLALGGGIAAIIGFGCIAGATLKDEYLDLMRRRYGFDW